jgi:hypothetical protein
MKLLMENWRKFLKEGISDVVYHYTSGITKAAQILEENKFMASGGFTKEVETELGKGKLYYFSTARTPVNAYTGNYPQGAIFKLDGRALAQKYKGAPVDYWADPKRGKSSKLAANVGKTGHIDAFEAEDRILLDEPYIEDADTYIDEIHFAIPIYKKEKDMFSGKIERRPRGSIAWWQLDGLQRGVAVAEQRNIPYYIHIDQSTYPHVEVGKKKAFTKLSDFMVELEKSGVKVGDKPGPLRTPEEKAEYDKLVGDRVSKEIGEDDVFLFVQAAQDILAGKEQFEGTNVQGKVDYSDEKERKRKATAFFRGLAGSPNAAGRFVRDINNPLHNVSSNPKARKTLEMLASLMRSTKQKTIKDLENYLNQVYKKNHPDGDPTGYRDL